MNSKGRQIMNNDIEKILFDQAQLDKRMDEMAAELNQKYEGKQPIVQQMKTAQKQAEEHRGQTAPKKSVPHRDER